MNTEITLLYWQHFKDGKVIKMVEIDTITTKSELKEIAKEIALKENISAKEIFFIYKEKI